MTATRIGGQLSLIRQTVQQAEQGLMRSAIRRRTWPGGWGSFPTRGARRPSYGATPPELMLRCLIEINQTPTRILRPELHFAVLGSGLGMASFTAARYFSRVTGFEIDPRLTSAAEWIRARFSILNVEFRLMDFIKADLTGFEVIYFYHPFLEMFVEVMGEKLLETAPGTVVISRSFTHRDLFPSAAFSRIYPRSEEHPRNLSLTSFFAYVRKEKRPWIAPGPDQLIQADR